MDIYYISGYLYIGDWLHKIGFCSQFDDDDDDDDCVLCSSGVLSLIATCFVNVTSPFIFRISFLNLNCVDIGIFEF